MCFFLLADLFGKNKLRCRSLFILHGGLAFGRVDLEVLFVIGRLVNIGTSRERKPCTSQPKMHRWGELNHCTFCLAFGLF